VNYLDVVNAQQNLLSNEQEAAIIHGQRLVTAVLLVKALGGGWDAASIAAVQEKPHLKDIVAPLTSEFQSQHGQVRTLFHPNSRFHPLPSNLPVMVLTSD